LCSVSEHILHIVLFQKQNDVEVNGEDASSDEESDSSDSTEDEPIKAPFELLGEFLQYIRYMVCLGVLKFIFMQSVCPALQRGQMGGCAKTLSNDSYI